MFEDYSYKVSWLYHFPFRNYEQGGGGEDGGLIGLRPQSLTFEAPIPKNGQTHSNIVFDDFMNVALKGLTLGYLEDGL